MIKLLVFALMFVPSILFAEEKTYYSWGGSSATLNLADNKDHYAELTFDNIISGGHDLIVNFRLGIEDLEVRVRVEHQYGNLPDRHIIKVSEGYWADITNIDMQDRTKIVVKIYKEVALVG